MEGFHGSIGNGGGGGNYSKATKIKIPPGMKTHHLMIGSGRYHGNPVNHTIFDSYSENLDLNAPLIRYMCSGSPVTGKLALAGDGCFVPRGSLSPLLDVENLIERSPRPSPPVYRTPAKAVDGEETLLMDGVLVSGGGKRTSSFSGSDSTSASGSAGKSLFKTDSCRSSEDAGSCRYSSKRQFVLGKEDLRSTHLSIKNKIESQACRSYKSPGLTAYSPNSLFLPQVIPPIFTEAAVTTASPTISRTPTKTASPTASITSIKTPSPNTSMTPIKTPSPTTSTTPIKTPSTTTSMIPIKTPSPPTSINKKNTLCIAITWKDWSPQDDGIEVALPCSSTGKPPSRESVNAYIDKVLSGRTSRRLPVFSAICSE